MECCYASNVVARGMGWGELRKSGRDRKEGNMIMFHRSRDPWSARTKGTSRRDENVRPKISKFKCVF